MYINNARVCNHSNWLFVVAMFINIFFKFNLIAFVLCAITIFFCYAIRNVVINKIPISRWPTFHNRSQIKANCIWLMLFYYLFFFCLANLIVSDQWHIELHVGQSTWPRLSYLFKPRERFVFVCRHRLANEC